MSKPRLALKLTSRNGRTANGYVLLKVGLTVKRAKRGPLSPCSSFAVHAYKDLSQAWHYASKHCCHGDMGIVWLVKVRNPRSLSYPDYKIIGTSYRVIKRLGTLSDLYFGKRDYVAELLRGGVK